jgi:uncharacterized protein (TIGR01777 family)
MHIVIAGGRGLLGHALARRLRADGNEVIVLTRTPRGRGEVKWDPAAGDDAWRAAVASADAVVNLAGESIAGRRWTSARKTDLLESRVQSTRALVLAIRASSHPPPAFLSGSAVGIYGPRGDEPIDEDTPPGSDFLARVCVAWENEARAASDRCRVVLLRTGLVFAREGGAFPQMALPFRLFVGGPIASGRQYVPWIHIDDWVEMARWAIATAACAGPLNVTAPNPVTNREFARTLGRVLGRPALMPAPAFALRIALGEMADSVVTGQRVLPAHAERLGFTFGFPELEPALRSLLGESSKRRVRL